MPAKNAIKQYVEDSYYHIYNRGVEKRIIFQDEQDYRVLLSYLKGALLPPINPELLTEDVSFKGQAFKGIPRQPKNFHGAIDMITFCLMPNHFHFLVHQTGKSDIKEFIHSLFTRYTSYFNKKYHRVGSLLQGRYKAVRITEDEYLLHVSRYIHRNPIDQYKNLTSAYSSYGTYLGDTHHAWVNPSPVLSFFTDHANEKGIKTNSYQDFVEEYEQNDSEILGSLAIDEDSLDEIPV